MSRCLSHSDAETGVFQGNLVNVLAVDSIAFCVAKPLVNMELNMQNNWALVIHKKIFLCQLSDENDRSKYMFMLDEINSARWEFTDVHYDDVTMGAIASLITSLAIVYLTAYSDADQRKHKSSASLGFVWGISPHKWPVTRKMFPFDDVIMNKRAPRLTKLTNVLSN